MHKIVSMQKNITLSGHAPPLVEQAFTRLRSDVLTGTFEAGAKLKLEELQGAYGFSSSPLREALSRLAQEGLVRSDERRGFRVAPISESDLADIIRMRLMLDVPALRDAIANGDDAWEASIVAASHRLEKLESRLSDGSAVLGDDWGEAHRQFHRCLLAACGSERQLAWSASLFDQAERYRRFSARHRQVSRRKNDEHKRLMNAVLKRDADTACALLEEHILATERNVRLALRKLSAAN
jgi:DNA-binding GntR family transcriptional regulator